MSPDLSPKNDDKLELEPAVAVRAWLTDSR